MSTKRWFHAHISGPDAEDLLLEKGQDGSFLCRPSQTNPGDYTLSVRQGTKVTHVKIQRTGDYCSLHGAEKFCSLGELVFFYIDNPGQLFEKDGTAIELKHPLNCAEVTSERWYHSSLTGREAETVLLAMGQDGSFLVRSSVHNPGSYVLSARTDDHVSHVMIRHKYGHFNIDQGPSFRTLQELVDHYKKNPMEENSRAVIHLKYPFNATSFLPSSIKQRFSDLEKENHDVYGEAGFWEEFEQLQQQECKHLYSCTEGARPENDAKNRYKNILPFDHTRVVLRDVDGSPGSDYINANFISGEVPGTEKMYIATQGCLPDTVNEFWKMIWQEQTQVVVMTTNEVESERNKCTRYWPDLGEQFEAIHVCNLKETANPYYTLRDFLVLNENEDCEGGRHVYLYQFTAWPEHSAPDNPGPLLDLLQDVNLKQKLLTDEGLKPGPIVVHGSAGIGRTGTFIVIDILLNLIAYQGWDSEIDIQKTVQLVRAQRSGMVQTEQQYKFVYQAIQHFVESQQAQPQDLETDPLISPVRSPARDEPLHSNMSDAPTTPPDP